MKNQGDRSRGEVELAVGDMVHLKLQPYRQKAMDRRFWLKLAAKLYGPYRVLERTCSTVYKLLHFPETRIHLVFHISQLKIALGQQDQRNVLPLGSIISG